MSAFRGAGPAGSDDFTAGFPSSQAALIPQGVRSRWMALGRGTVVKAADWRAQLRQRLPAHWVFKLLGITTFMWVFFFGYFLVLRSPRFEVHVMALTWLDRWIEFHPTSIGLYFSLWLYVLVPPSLLGNKSELARFAIGSAATAVLGFAIFLFWPTVIPRMGTDWAVYPTFAWLKKIDAAGNACPSLHAAFAVFSAVWLGRSLRELGDRGFFRLLNLGWCWGILYSTLATKQHVAWDVLGGVGLGLIVAYLTVPASRKLPPLTD